MANTKFERLENGNVRYTKNNEVNTVPGSAFISSNAVTKKVYVRFSRPEYDFQIDADNDTVSQDDGDAISGLQDIHEKLDTDIFFLTNGQQDPEAGPYDSILMTVQGEETQVRFIAARDDDNNIVLKQSDV